MPYYTQGRIYKQSIQLGSETIFFRNIGSISITKEDIRPRLQKWLFKDPSSGVDPLIMLLMPLLLGLAWIVSLLCLLYVGIEYALSAFDIEGFLSKIEQQEWLETSGGVAIFIPILAITQPIRDSLDRKFGVPLWEWTLRIGGSDGKNYFLRPCNSKIVDLHEIIKEGASGEGLEKNLAFDLQAGIIEEC